MVLCETAARPVPATDNLAFPNRHNMHAHHWHITTHVRFTRSEWPAWYIYIPLSHPHGPVSNPAITVIVYDQQRCHVFPGGQRAEGPLKTRGRGRYRFRQASIDAEISSRPGNRAVDLYPIGIRLLLHLVPCPEHVQRWPAKRKLMFKKSGRVVFDRFVSLREHPSSTRKDDAKQQDQQHRAVRQQTLQTADRLYSMPIHANKGSAQDMTIPTDRSRRLFCSERPVRFDHSPSSRNRR